MIIKEIMYNNICLANFCIQYAFMHIITTNITHVSLYTNRSFNISAASMWNKPILSTSRTLSILIFRKKNEETSFIIIFFYC